MHTTDDDKFVPTEACLRSSRLVDKRLTTILKIAMSIMSRDDTDPNQCIKELRIAIDDLGIETANAIEEMRIHSRDINASMKPKSKIEPVRKRKYKV